MIVALTLIMSACFPGDPGFTIVVENPCSHDVAIRLWDDHDPDDDVDTRLNEQEMVVAAQSSVVIASTGKNYEEVVVAPELGWSQRKPVPEYGQDVVFVIDRGLCLAEGS